MKKLLLTLVAIGFSISTFAQKTVSGQVLEQDTNIPLLGVSVLVQGANIGTSTDFDGNYEISGVRENTILIFSYIGYKSLEVAVGTQSTINVSLEVDAQKMDEVVVTALNIQRDKESLGIHTEPAVFDKPTLFFHLTLESL